ncbi:MAG: MFS transporter [Anaerolineaceae bacterium]|jgi:MFS family permease|nr:MFS transporter [Anaerolineaceae bacterium]MDD4043598.1 MFS transporter [Anaerolineaceae bacterium]MDD4578148.1 MFS transporter [Anaerolineaceae bacterium]
MDESEQPTQKAPLLSPVLRLFLLTMILANIAGAMYGGFLPLYLKSLGADVAQIGLFFTISQIIPLALQILGGWISDSLGRLKSIAAGSVSGVVSYIALILAPTWGWVFLGEGLNAITRSLVGPSFGAYIAEESQEDNRAKVYGLVDTFYTVVAIVGPPFGGFLVDRYGFKTMLMVAASIYSVATVIRVQMARKAKHPGAEDGKKPSLQLKALKVNLSAIFGLVVAGGVMTWIVVTDGIRDISSSLINSLVPVYLEGIANMSAQQIGWLTSILGIAMMITSYPAGHLADRRGERLAIALGFVLQSIASFIFIKSASFFGYAVTYFLLGMGFSLMSPAYQSLLSKVLPQRLRGTGFGLVHSGLGLFSLPAPAIGAKLYENISPTTPFWISFGASVLAIFPVVFKFKPTDKDREQIEKAEAKVDQAGETD